MAVRAHARILLDAPSVNPALNFNDTAEALASIIEGSQAQFAIGIFGGWGSGKTTLMRAIQRQLVGSIVKVEFNAWRYEREPHLLVPLLDTIRSALLDWSKGLPANHRERARTLARRIGRVVRALASGLSAEVGIPQVATVSYDLGQAVSAMAVDEDADSPQSLYFAAFQQLQQAFKEFSARGARRIVVFVDDLDRCLPGNALEVLESIKLFFDLQGFVFVVGLDESVVQRAVRARFREPGWLAQEVPARGSDSPSAVSIDEKIERDYVEKIFQVPYRLPPIVDRQLNELLTAVCSEADLSPEQLTDLRRAGPYLESVAINGHVNPREVKRFLNTYTLQGLIRPSLDRDTVLALQTILFRYDWRTLYGFIVADSSRFVAALEQYRGGDFRAFESLSPDLAVLPPDLGDFLSSKCAAALCTQPTLDPYLSSLESTRVSSPAWLSVAYQELGRFCRELRRVHGLSEQNETESRRLHASAREVISHLHQMVNDPGSGSTAQPAQTAPILELLRELERKISQLEPEPAATLAQRIPQAATEMLGTAEAIYRELRKFR